MQDRTSIMFYLQKPPGSRLESTPPRAAGREILRIIRFAAREEGPDFISPGNCTDVVFRSGLCAQDELDTSLPSFLRLRLITLQQILFHCSFFSFPYLFAFIFFPFLLTISREINFQLATVHFPQNIERTVSQWREGKRKKVKR